MRDHFRNFEFKRTPVKTRQSKIQIGKSNIGFQEMSHEQQTQSKT